MKMRKAGIFIAIFLCIAIMCTTVIVAFAATDFDADTEGGAVYPSGCSEAELKTALNDKVKDMNAAIKIALDAGKTLENAYNAGEIVAYSRRNDGVINSDNRRSGWKVWEGAAVTDLKYLNAGYDDWGDHSVGWLSYNGVTKKAHIITGEFANKFGRDGNQKLGSAVSDMFRIVMGTNYVAYQNFTSGYIKSDNGTTTVINKKNVVLNAAKTDVTEIDADPTSTGIIGAATSETLDKAGIDRQAFAKTFADAYTSYKASGIDVGFPWSPVMNSGKNSSNSDRYGAIVTQNFRWGSSVSDPWNDAGRSGWSFLAYNFEQAKVYLIRDEFHAVFEKDDGGDKNAKVLGDPTGDDFVYDGNRYQNFEKGYLKADGIAAANTNVSAVVAGKNMTKDGEVAIDAKVKIGKLGKTASVPAGYTSESFTAACVAAYNSKVNLSDLVGVDLVEKNGDMLLQKYTDSKGGTHALFFVNNRDGGNGEFYYLLPSVYTVYTENSALGVPTKDFFEAAKNDSAVIYAYPFANGYIKLTVSEQEDFNDAGDVVTVTNYSAIATVGATFDAEKNFFETTSYADKITDAIVNAKVSEAYDFLKIPEKVELAKIFKDAYIAAFNKGFCAGDPASEGITWWTTGESGVVKLTLKGGNGNANFWGDNTLMTYNPVDKKVYISTAKIANMYANDGASGNGWAKTEMMLNTKTGTIVQQFDIHDKVVEERPVYIISEGGQTQKVPGTYNFEENKNGGEWVEYITRFGGSISAKPIVVEESYKKGTAISIDFSKFLENGAKYNTKYVLKSDKGSVSAAGIFTFTPDAKGNISVIIEAYSAFDKITLSATLNVIDDAVAPAPAPEADGGCGGCGSNMVGGIAGILVLLAGAMFIMLAKRKIKNG